MHLVIVNVTYKVFDNYHVNQNDITEHKNTAINVDFSEFEIYDQPNDTAV